MRYQMNFGTLRPRGEGRSRGTGDPFRIALLGDFSGRANAGRLETGDELARRKPVRVDVDNLDDVLERFAPVLHLPVGRDEGVVELRPRSIDELHPDELYDGLEIFEELSTLRRQLDNTSTFARAVTEVQGWLGAGAVERVQRRRGRRSRGAAVPVSGRLDDFARLIGQPTAAAEPTPADELIRQVMASHVVAADDPDQGAWIAALDDALAVTLRGVLHHPDFQALEAAWRSLDFLVRRLETGPDLQLVVYDVSAEELAADLSATDDLGETGLYRLLVEQPGLDAHQGALSVLAGLYTFEQTPPHAELLARVARLASAAGAPFVAAMGPDCVDVRPEDLHPLVQEAWDALRGLPEARYLGLAVPRFLLRTPYGRRSDPIDSFGFEEFDPRRGLRAMLWGNPAVLAATLLGETWSQQGAGMRLGSVLGLGDMPYHFYTDADGDQVALPCTDRLLTERKAANVGAQCLIPVLSIRGRPEVRLGGFQSLAGQELAGRWTDAAEISALAGAVAESAARPAPSAASPREGAQAVDGRGPPEPALDEVDMDSGTGVGEDDGGSDDLDALLASLESDDAEDSEPGDDDEMDPELKALLDDL